MIEVDNKADLNKLLEKNSKVLALFYATWCPYCQNFLRSFDRNITDYNCDMVLRVNLNDYDNPLWDDFSVEAVPTVILFENKEVTNRLDGGSGKGLNETQLKEWLKALKK